MRKTLLLGASTLLLALGVASASAEPFDPVTGYSGHGAMSEGRAAAIDGQGPYSNLPAPYVQSTGPGSVLLEQFHEGK